MCIIVLLSLIILKLYLLILIILSHNSIYILSILLPWWKKEKRIGCPVTLVKKKTVNRAANKVSYIIRLEQPSHGKESFSGFCGSKVLTLKKIKEFRDESVHREREMLKKWDIITNLVEQVDDLRQDVQTSSRIDGCLVEDPSLWNKHAV